MKSYHQNFKYRIDDVIGFEF